MATRVDQTKRSKAAVERLDPIEAAVQYGIDIQQLRDNLALPVGERIRRHQIALNTVELLQKAKRL